jgi:hypothetical protein
MFNLQSGLAFLHFSSTFITPRINDHTYFSTNRNRRTQLTVAEMFKGLCENVKLLPEKVQSIRFRYGEVTSALNNKFRNTDSKTANSLQVGSYGRRTAIKGISDLDMVYIIPSSKWKTYEENQLSLLSDTKNAILERYPRTTVRIDRLVVQVIYANFMIEVQPVFEVNNGNFRYPDTYNGGSWKVTKPREEIQAMIEFDEQKNNNLRKLCRISRSWKNKNGIAIGGLLIDTLAYNFLKQTAKYDEKSFSSYDSLSLDYFA